MDPIERESKHCQMSDLNKYLVSSLPGKLYCISDFVNEEEEKHTLKKIYEAPKVKWTTLLNRRLQNWGGLPSEKVRHKKFLG